MAGRNGRLDSRSQEVRKALKTLSEKGTGGTERGREGEREGATEGGRGSDQRGDLLTVHE